MKSRIVFLIVAMTLASGCATTGNVSPSNPRYERIVDCGANLMTFIILDSVLEKSFSSGLYSGKIPEKFFSEAMKIAKEHPSIHYGKLVNTDIGSDGIDAAGRKANAVAANIIAAGKYNYKDDEVRMIDDAIPNLLSKAQSSCREADYEFTAINRITKATVLSDMRLKEEERLQAEAKRKEEDGLQAEAKRKEEERLQAEVKRKEEERLQAESKRKAEERLPSAPVEIKGSTGGTPPVVQGKWKISRKKDQMTDGIRVDACTKSVNSIRQGFPYNRGATFAELCLHRYSDGSREVSIEITQGQLLCQTYDSIWLRVDEAGRSLYECGPSAGMRPQLGFFKLGERPFKEIRDAQYIIRVELDVYNYGSPVFQFGPITGNVPKEFMESIGN